MSAEREQAAALRLADNLENLEATGSGGDYFVLTEWSQRRALEAASELRRLHAENKALMNLLRRAQPAQAVPVLSEEEIAALCCADSFPVSKKLFIKLVEQAVRAKMGAGVGWQPIETAPKDFVTEFDGWNGERVPNVSWAHPEYSPKGHLDWCASEYETGHGWVNVAVKNLTHWMPLPPPPGIVGKEANHDQ